MSDSGAQSSGAPTPGGELEQFVAASGGEGETSSPSSRPIGANGRKFVRYNGRFELAWLADDEQVAASGDRDGSCIIYSPRGDVRVNLGDKIEVPRG